MGGEVRLEFVNGDITAQVVDVIVDAANSGLLGGGGVDGAIHRAAGPEISAECRRLRGTVLPDGLPVGEAVATLAGRLAAKWVIHTVGPMYSPREDRSSSLASCFRRSLEVAQDLGARSVAFPAVSTGAYGWPIADAARIAHEAVTARHWDLDVVRFVIQDPAQFRQFVQAFHGAPHPTGTSD